MLKVCKFGGSSVAGAEQFRKVRDIVLSDDSRRVVVISAAGKRTSDDHKLTDLLYLCHAHLTYGVSCADILAAIRSRFVSIRDELGLSYRVEDEFDAYAATLSRDTSVDELVSRGEYFTARLMAETLGYAFVDAADCVFFGFDGQFDRARTDAAIEDAYTQWYDNLSDIEQEGFAEAWPMIKEDAAALLKDKDAMAGRLDDVGLEADKLTFSEKDWNALEEVVDPLVPEAKGEY